MFAGGGLVGLVDGGNLSAFHPSQESLAGDPERGTYLDGRP